MSPALRSASIAICLPGSASSVKRADTSETRPAPLVTTIRLMMTMIANTNRPTT
jgi:chemotaxis protein MotB